MGRAEPTAAMQAHVADAKLAVLATTGPRGPHAAPVWFLYRDGEFLLSTGVHRQKAKNIQRDDRVGLAVLAEAGTPAVMIDGRARLDHIDSFGLVAELAERYLGTETGADYVRRLSTEMTPGTLWRVIVRPTSWKSWALNEEPGDLVTQMMPAVSRQGPTAREDAS